MYTAPSHLVSAACLSLCLLPAVSGLYFTNGEGDPYHHDKPTVQQRAPPHSSRDSLTLPLHRIIKPRDNVYNITKSKTPTAKDSVAVDQDGADLTYMVAAKLGTSKEEWYFLVDSASSNSWVMSKECKTEACGFHNLFGPDDSTTLKTTNSRFDIAYGTGQASGIVGRDTMQIGNLKFTSDFGLATNVSYEFAAYPIDGIMALGRGDRFPSGGVETDSNLIMNELVKQGQIKTKIYGLHLGRSATGNHDGEINFGTLNKDRYDGDLNWSKVKDNDNGFWWITLGGAGVGTTALEFPNREAIMDSGTSFMLIPPGDAEILHSPFKNLAGYAKEDIFYYVPCDTKDPIFLTFNNKRYNIPAENWIAKKDAQGRCRSNFQARATFGDKTWLVGDTFLKNVYSVYDYDNSQVGIGVKNGNGNSNSGTPSNTAAPGPASTAGGSESKPSPTSSLLVPSGSGPSNQPSPTLANNSQKPPNASGTPTQGSGSGTGTANGQQGGASSVVMKPSQSALLALALAIGGAMMV